MIFLLRVPLLFVILFTAAILIVRGGHILFYPIDNVDVFTQPECETPCWIGIEPGVTPTNEVATILEETGYIVTANRDDPIVGTYISFEDPDNIQVTLATRNIIRGEFGIVTVIAVTQTHCPIQFLLKYGIPAQVYLSPTPNRHQDIVLHYPDVPITLWLDHDRRANELIGVRATTLASEDIFSHLFDQSQRVTWHEALPLMYGVTCHT